MTETDMTTAQAREIWLNFLREPGRMKAVAALEEMHHSDMRCCLGHACAALGVDRKVDIIDYVEHVFYDGEFSVLPDSVARLLDIGPNGPFHRPIMKQQYVCIAAVNDKTNLTPAQIADVIEDQFAAGNFLTYAEHVQETGNTKGLMK